MRLAIANFPLAINTILEPPRRTPVACEVDVCVLGGSCTGVFAAIRAARLGARVALVERANCFGGVATISLVCVWHSLWNTTGTRQIISGLTEETMERLRRRGALKLYERTNPSIGCTFNPEELKLVLDEMVQAEPAIKSFLHTSFVAPWVEDGELRGVLVENKSGRAAIKARVFIDATGDGDLAARLGCRTYRANQIQPATTCAVLSGWDSLGTGSQDFQTLLRDHAAEFGLPEGFAWGCRIPGSDNYMLAATRVYGADPSDADDMTKIEFEGRRQVRGILDILRKVVPENCVSLAALPSRAGLRESRHVRCAYQLTGDDVLSGRSFKDAIAYGSYRVDIHHQDKPGITLRYLDGHEEYHRPGYPMEHGRWRPTTGVDPTFYQIPFATMRVSEYDNLLVAGRMIDTDSVAHAAVRVMVNLNQVGEAAGVASALALNNAGSILQTDVSHLQKTLAEGGSIVL